MVTEQEQEVAFEAALNNMDGRPRGLVAALARAQAKFPPILKSHENPHFKSQFADVADVLEAVRPVLAAEGIVVTQFTHMAEDGTVLLTTALRVGTESLKSHFPLLVQGLTAQQVGSLLTYHRRYQLCAILGVHPVGDDDDGNLAAQAAPRPNVVTQGLSGAPAALPEDWQTRPLASMTFAELRGVAAELNHTFTGGSKSELIRQLEPLVRAASGAEPFDVNPDFSQSSDNIARTVTKPDPADIPFNPTVFDNSEARESADAALKRLRPDARASVRKADA